MRPSFKVTLLLFSLLLSEQMQGIRLETNYYMSVEQHKSIHVEENTLTKTKNVNGVPQEAVACKLDGDCISGNNRKLMINVTPSTTTSKNQKKGKNKSDPISNGQKGTNKSQQYGGEEEKSSISGSSATVNSLNTSEEHPEYEHYPDVIDLDEMDYSPARRKTPIHN